MRSVPVVLVDPGFEAVFSVAGVLVGTDVGPFSERGLDEAFCFTVGSWRVGPGAAVLEAELFAGVGEGVGTVGRSLVGEHGFEVDAETCVVGQSLGGEVEDRGAGLVRVDGRGGDAAVVVDSDMDILGADTLDGIAAVAGDANGWAVRS